MTAYLIAVIVFAVAALIAVLAVEARQDNGTRARRGGPRPLARAAAALGRPGLWFWLASGEFMLPPGPRPIVSDREVREEFERLAAERGTPVFDELADERARAQRWERLPELPASHPYPLPTMYPRTAGDGLIVATPDGCEVVRRAAASRAARNPTLLDLPVVAGVRRDSQLDGIEWEHGPGQDTLRRVLDGLRALDVTS